MKVTSIRCLCFVVVVIAMLAVAPGVNGQRGNFDDVEITTTNWTTISTTCKAGEDRSGCWPAPTAS